MTPRSAFDKPAVAVISSHVARGSVGSRAAVFGLETLGFPVWSVHTVSLPWHPGHGPAPRLVPDDAAFADYMEALGGSPHLGEIGAVLTGYLGSAKQAVPIARFIQAVRRENPDALHICDPVIGDEGGLYVPEAVAVEIRDRLFESADIVTPNRFELAWLTGRALESNTDILSAAQAIDIDHVLVTSAFSLLAGGTGNLLVGGPTAILAEHRNIENPPNGPGDLTAALFTGHLLSSADAADRGESVAAAARLNRLCVR
jgi:pyridoxine kinase